MKQKKEKTLQRNNKIWLNKRIEVNTTIVKKRKKRTESKEGKPGIGKMNVRRNTAKVGRLKLNRLIFK